MIDKKRRLKVLLLFTILLTSLLAGIASASPPTDNTLATNSLQDAFTYSFTQIPFFALGILILAFGSTFVRTHKLALSMLFTSIVSFILFSLNAIDISISAIVTLMFVFIFMYETWRKKGREQIDLGIGST